MCTLGSLNYLALANKTRRQPQIMERKGKERRKDDKDIECGIYFTLVNWRGNVLEKALSLCLRNWTFMEGLKLVQVVFINYRYYVSDLAEEDYSCNTEYSSPIAVLSGTAAAITWLSFNITFIYLGWYTL